MQIRRTQFHGLAEDIKILDGAESMRALTLLASFHGVPVSVMRAELAAGLRLVSHAAMYEATVAPVGSTVWV